MHLHFPTDTTLLIASPVAGILLSFILMVIIDRALARRGSEILAPILGIIVLIAVPIIGVAIPFIV